MDGMVPAALGLGFVLGMRHVLDPDHVAAVSTIVSEHASLRKSSLVGTFWGVGHTMSLLVVGVAVIALKITIPDPLVLWMELAVALMLVLLGVRALSNVVGGWTMHIHMHTHDGRKHIHLHMHRPEEPHVHEHRHPFGFGARPFIVGIVHGLAGSAALMILVLASIPSTIGALAYIIFFGLGSIGGMMALSGLLSVPIVLSEKRFTLFSEVVQLFAGVFSIAFGSILIWRYGFQQHLLF